jgi:hypothetical protein
MKTVEKSAILVVSNSLRELFFDRQHDGRFRGLRNDFVCFV